MCWPRDYLSCTPVQWRIGNTITGNFKVRRLGNVGARLSAFTHFQANTTALRQVTMKGIACTFEWIERRVDINTVDMTVVRFIRTIEKMGMGFCGLRFFGISNSFIWGGAGMCK